MKLYTFFRSSASFRVRIALNHKGLKYEPAGVNLPKGEHLDYDYKSINVQGLVPALEDGGRILTQSLAIMEYLDEIHPGPKLLPADPLDRAYVRALSQIIACEIHPLNNLRTRKYISKTYKLDEEGVNNWYRHWIAEGFQMMESFLARERKHGKYCYREVLLPRPGHHGRLLPGAAGVQRNCLQVRPPTLSNGDAHTRNVHEARRLSRSPAFQAAGCCVIVAPRTRIERATCPLGGGCSIH